LIGKLKKLHDWEIVAVSVDRKKFCLKIVLAMPKTNEQISLIFEGVSRFFLTGMTTQNVILDVLLFENEEENSDYFNHSISLLGINGSDLKNNKKKIAYFEPSVGAEMACFFSDLKFSSLP
jgi:hypothetical protein